MVGSIGCASSPRVARVAMEPVVLRAGGAAGIELVIYGDLLDRLEPPPRQDRLAEFLYGPEPGGPPALLRYPQGLLVVGDTVLVGDQGFPDVMAVDLRGGTVRRWTARSGRPACPVQLAEGGAGRVIVVDPSQRGVLIYDRDGRLESTLYGPGVPDAQSATWRPSAALVHAGVLHVADPALPGAHRYELASGEWIAAVGDARSPFVAPTGLAMTGDGVLLVADSVAGVVHRIDAAGRRQPAIGAPGRGFGEFVRPMHVAVTPQGWIAVTDAARQTLQIYASDGRCVAELGREDRSFRGFTLPLGVTDAESLRAMLSEPGAHHPPRADEALLLVSDALGPSSLTLIGVREIRD